jgi:hypothetical protein
MSMRKLLTAAALGSALLAAACGPSPGDGYLLFTPQDGGTVHPGYPRTNAAPTVTDMFGNTVAAPGMNLSHGGSTTQSLGVQAPGAANTSGGGGMGSR